MNESGETKLSMHIVIKAFHPTSILKLTVECQTPAAEALVNMSAANFSNDDELGAAASCIDLVVDRNDAEFSKQKTRKRVSVVFHALLLILKQAVILKKFLMFRWRKRRMSKVRRSAKKMSQNDGFQKREEARRRCSG